MPSPAKSSWRVEPVGPLQGDVSVRGSKNAVTKHMVAAVMGRSPSTVLNCPQIGDIEITSEMLRSLGCGVAVDDGSVIVEPNNIDTGRVPVSYGGLNRIPILLVGPLLHRMGEAFVPLVGGDRIGTRPLDFHVSSLEAMGAEVAMTPEGLEAKALGLHGARIRLPFPSVGSTAGSSSRASIVSREPSTASTAIESRPSATWRRVWSPAGGCGCTAVPRAGWSRPSRRCTAWALASRSPTTGWPCRPGACGRRWSRPTPTRGS
jgi:UDP-N-acetylglucosamine 1-carboxyvinyltransferase